MQWILAGNHPLLFGTVSPTKLGQKPSRRQPQVTTPYCSGLSLLPTPYLVKEEWEHE